MTKFIYSLKVAVLLLTAFCLIWACSKKADPIPLPAAAFSYSSTGTGEISFTNQSTNADSYSWDFGDGTAPSTEKSPKRTYSKNGTYKATLTVKNTTGTNSLSKDVVVSNFPAPKSAFTFLLGANGLMTLTNKSTDADVFDWDFGDGTTSKDASPSKTYTSNGKFTVKLTAVGKGGNNQSSQDIEIVSYAPVADFSWAEAVGTVSFVNTSKNADSYSWNFGDGKTSTEMSPKYTYAKNGAYTVVLTATNKGGSVRSTKTVTVAGVEVLAFDGCAVTNLSNRNRSDLLNVGYDAQGRPATISIFQDKYSVTYKTLSQIDKVIFTNSVFNYTYEYTYTNGALDKIVEKNGITNTSATIVITNTNGVMTKIVRTPLAPSTQSVTTLNMAYDSKRNLTKAAIVIGSDESFEMQYTSFDNNVSPYSRANIFRDVFPAITFNTKSYYEFLCTNNPTAGKYPSSPTQQKDFTVRYTTYNAKKQPTAYIWADGPLSINEVNFTLVYDCTK